VQWRLLPNVIPATVRDATYMLAEILNDETGADGVRYHARGW
jgi:hypothetical protein